MSFSTLFYVAICFGLYKLGAFNAQRPGELHAMLKLACRRTWQWMHQ